MTKINVNIIVTIIIVDLDISGGRGISYRGI